MSGGKESILWQKLLKNTIERLSDLVCRFHCFLFDTEMFCFCQNHHYQLHFSFIRQKKRKFQHKKSYRNNSARKSFFYLFISIKTFFTIHWAIFARKKSDVIVCVETYLRGWLIHPNELIFWPEHKNKQDSEIFFHLIAKSLNLMSV